MCQHIDSSPSGEVGVRQERATMKRKHSVSSAVPVFCGDRSQPNQTSPQPGGAWQSGKRIKGKLSKSKKTSVGLPLPHPIPPQSLKGVMRGYFGGSMVGSQACSTLPYLVVP